MTAERLSKLPYELDAFASTSFLAARTVSGVGSTST